MESFYFNACLIFFRGVQRKDRYEKVGLANRIYVSFMVESDVLDARRLGSDRAASFCELHADGTKLRLEVEKTARIPTHHQENRFRILKKNP